MTCTNLCTIIITIEFFNTAHKLKNFEAESPPRVGEYAAATHQQQQQPTNKHQSIHMYSSIDTIKHCPQFEGMSFQPRTVSGIQSPDYEELSERMPQPAEACPLPSSSMNKSSESLQTFTMENSLPPTEYEVPLSLSTSSRRSSDCTLRCSIDSSLSSGSWPDQVSWLPLNESTYIEMDSDFDLWRKHSEKMHAQQKENEADTDSQLSPQASHRYRTVVSLQNT